MDSLSVQVSIFPDSEGFQHLVFSDSRVKIELTYPGEPTDEELYVAQEMCYNFPELVAQALNHMGGA